jgi:hypothetical protein
MRREALGRRVKHGTYISRGSPALIARHTFSAVAGICTYGAPIWASAWLTAFITDDNAPTVPDSPAPLTPRGLVLVGTSFSPNVNEQK